MDTINLKEARRRFKDLVDAAERGETIIITRRGRKVARLGPVPRRRPAAFPDLAAFRATIRVTGKPLSQVVIDSRRGARY